MMTTQSSTIHPTAIVEDGAKIGNSCKIGPYCCIGSEVTLDDNVTLDSHVVISGKTFIGKGIDNKGLLIAQNLKDQRIVKFSSGEVSLKLKK